MLPRSRGLRRCRNPLLRLLLYEPRSQRLFARC